MTILREAAQMARKFVDKVIMKGRQEPLKAVTEVTDCRDCHYAKDYRGHGECWKDCQHPQHNQGAYGNILWGCQASFKATPSWCPLKENK